ncbi:hypothetical protein [Rhizobium phage RHph_X2_24]|nr:hypothetical protein [Rhizobium phage RHph_X2_24]
MNFEISCETFVRLAGVTRRMLDNVADDERAGLKCVRLEYKSGNAYAIATNRKVAAIYHLGTTANPDGVAHVICDDALIKQCETEKPFNSSLFVTALPELQIVSAKTTLGYNYPGNAGVFKYHPQLDRWNTWANPEPVKQSVGAMSWVTEDLLALNAASPSGNLAFPEFIDANKPVTLRDIKFPNFVALFMPNRTDDAGNVYTVEPAELPEWWIK